jgi:hypothetical protein
MNATDTDWINVAKPSGIHAWPLNQAWTVAQALYDITWNYAYDWTYLQGGLSNPTYTIPNGSWALTMFAPPGAYGVTFLVNDQDIARAQLTFVLLPHVHPKCITPALAAATPDNNPCVHGTYFNHTCICDGPWFFGDYCEHGTNCYPPYLNRIDDDCYCYCYFLHDV